MNILKFLPLCWLLLLAIAAHAQPNPDVELRPVNGRPTILENGQPIVPAAYDNSILWRIPEWEKWEDNMIAAGVKVFHLTPWHFNRKLGQSAFWTDDGVYPAAPPPAQDDENTMERQAQYILKRVPDARFIVRVGAYAPIPWVEKNPGEMQTDDDGKTYEPSWASQKYLDGVRADHNGLVRWVEAQSWGKRVLGYFVLPYGEGATILSINGHFFDHSAAMQRAWNDWLGRNYASDAALQAAWGDDAATRAGSKVPSDKELRAKLENLPTWPDPKQLQQARDYALLQRELYRRYIMTLTGSVKEAAARRVIVGLDAMKQPLLGWQINEAFFGTGRSTDQFSLYLASGSIDVGDLLDLPTLDCIVTPADYTARGMGWAFDAEGLTDSMVLRGKTMFIENDARTWLAKETQEDRKPPLGSFMTPDEVRAGLLRNTAQTVSRGILYYWTDITYSTSFYTAPEIQREIARNKDVLARATSWPHRETRDAIAMIIDDQSLLYGHYTTGFNQLAVVRQRIEGLALTGIPYRIYLLSDLKKDNFPDYRCYVFPNLFKVDDETIALLKKKVLRDGKVAIFGPGTGITDGATISAAGAEKLLGIPMKLTQGQSSRRVRLRRDGVVFKTTPIPTYGDSFSYGPILAPDRERLTSERVLGDLVSSWQVNAPGLVMKEFGRGAGGNSSHVARGAGDYAVVFSASTPIPAPVLRELARYGGCNVWVEGDAIVSGSDSAVSIHSASGGNFTIHLPRRARRIFDATTGQLVARNTDLISVKLAAPDTKMFFLE